MGLVVTAASMVPAVGFDCRPSRRSGVRSHCSFTLVSIGHLRGARPRRVGLIIAAIASTSIVLLALRHDAFVDEPGTAIALHRDRRAGVVADLVEATAPHPPVRRLRASGHGR
jgi:hypothetical protein